MLVLTRRSGESFFIGDNIEIKVSDISGDKVRISIDAPREISVLRSELLEAKRSNEDAAKSSSPNALAELKQLLQQKHNE